MTEPGKTLDKPDETRRSFVKAAFGLIAGAALFSVGAFTRIFEFFFGPRLPDNERAEILGLRLKRMQSSVHLAELELEREQNAFTLIAPLSDLNASTGKYFIDYQMRPALAFVDDKGLPNLISAKCTHLGCTVGNQVENGRILCPCHISYFNITTGQPNSGAPAKLPLDHLEWVLMDKNKKIIARKDAQGKISGSTDAASIKGADVYVAKASSGNQA
jgi:nitrite reductase/ring-hydroxylating ferredoxin subunit